MQGKERKNSSNNLKQEQRDKIETDRLYKTYKIYPLHYMLFYSCLDLCTRNKLTDYLIKEFISDNIADLPQFTKAELLDFMVTSISKESKITSFNTSNRISELISYLQQNGYRWDGVRVHLQTHILFSTYELISKLSEQTETIGEVLEIAIENYVNNASEEHYKIIKLAFQNNLKDSFLEENEN